MPRLLPPADLTQALLNLLNNAADACPDKLDIRLDPKSPPNSSPAMAH